MISVIALANARIELQIAWAAAYILLNIAHWIAAGLPRRLNWDFSDLEIKEQSIADGSARNRNFAETLWKTIILTKSASWARRADIAPRTEVWDDWLHEAQNVSKRVESHVGPLIDPMWGGDNPSKGTVWNVPQDWSAADTLVRIKREHRAATEFVRVSRQGV
jgi:hypothetical protein